MARTHEVNPGDIYEKGNTFYRLIRSWEGHHPTMDGMVFHLEVFRMNEGAWAPALPYFALANEEFNILSDEAKKMAGFNS